MKLSRSNIYQGLIAFLLGIMLTFAFAPFEIFPLAVIAPAGLCALIYHATSRQAFWTGYVFGTGLFTSGIYWIFISISEYGHVPDIGAYALTGALILFLSLYPAIACYFAARLFPRNDRARIVFALPSIWVLCEWVRCWLFTGFPWLLIGYSQTNSPLKGYAPILGVYGVSMAVMLSAGLIVYGVMQFRRKLYLSGYLHLFAFLCIWLFGAAFSLIPWTMPDGNAVTVDLVQGDIPQSLKWDPENVELSFNRYTEMTKPLWGKTSLIIWPEIAIPTPLQDTTSFVNKMSDYAIKNNSQLIFGIPVANKDETGYYNAIVSVGNSEAVYMKRQLVPFGEYIPFRRVLKSAFDILHVPMSNMTPGTFRQKPMKLGDLKILASICYEITYPMLSRTSDATVNMLLTVTNDAWFGKSTAQAQHLQMAVMRSIEMGRPGVFVSNNGITAFINQKGLITSTAPTHMPYVLKGSVQPYYGLTPWMRNGLDPVLAIIIVLLFTGYRMQRQQDAKQNN